MRRGVLAVVAGVLLVAACGGEAGPDRADQADAPTASAPTDDTPEDPVALAIADLAAHTGADAADIAEVEHEQVTWRDGSMGCPELGMSYTQALVDGYRIVLRARGQDVSYHGSTGEPPFRCDNPDPDGTVVGSTGKPKPTDSPEAQESADPDATKDQASPTAQVSKEDVMDEDGPLAGAIADLARQTGADPSGIEVVAHEQVTWRDGSLGCPEPGMMYTQALVDGYRIMLRSKGMDVSYHGKTGERPSRCDNPDPNGAV